MNNEVIYNLFSKKVKENPEALAVFDESRSLTRQELDNMVNIIASKIPENAERIGIVMDHSVEMIASILAVLKLGAAYIPAEPTFPKNRISFMMEDAQADYIITNRFYESLLSDFSLIFIDQENISEKPTNIISSNAKPDDLAYILYTSGSTGFPKGVSVLNRNVCHYIKAFENEFHPTEDDRILQYSVCSFDIFVEEVFPALSSGMAIGIVSEETKKDIKKVLDFVEKNKITIISGFPYLFLEMNHLEKIPDSLRLLISGGDTLRATYVDNLLDQADVYNTYGPSETTVCASYFYCNNSEPLPDGTYPIGKAVLGSKIELLDDNLNPVAEGEIGEICISGGGVTNGYFGNREKENKAFIKREDGSKLYRSGDLGYKLKDDNFAFINRKDTQVMIEGKRVEPTEVESVICNNEEIEQAAVKSFLDKNNLPYLVAYIVWNSEKGSIQNLRQNLANFLPSFMIPEYFIQMESLPLTINGKIDLKALPKIEKVD